MEIGLNDERKPSDPQDPVGDNQRVRSEAGSFEFSKGKRKSFYFLIVFA